MPAIRVIDRIRDQSDFGGTLADGYVLAYDLGTDTFRPTAAASGSVSSVTGTGAITCSPTTGSVIVSVAAASGSVPGTMSAADYATFHAATSANTVSTLVQRDGSGNFAANTITASSVTGLGTPTNASDAATKAYVDGIASGLSIKAPARVGTTAALASNAATATTLTASANSAFPAVDGVTPSVGDRVLVMNEATASHNGLYTLTTAGSGSVKWVLTRASDADTAAEVAEGMFVFVAEGTVNANSGFVLGATGGAVTLGTTALNFVQFSGAGEITAGTGLAKSGNTLSVSASYAGQTSITTVGTLTAGTWQGTVVGTAYIGTGTAGAGQYVDGGTGAWTTLPAYVSSVSVTSANGFAGTVATATTTPAITISTTVTGVLKGNGTAISAATAGTDYVIPSGSITGTSSNVTGTVAIANGGTGQIAAPAAFNALSPLTTLGDVLYASAANTAARLAGNTTATKKFLVQTGTGTVSAAPAWAVIAAGDVPDLSATYTTTAREGASSGVAQLDSGGKVPLAQIPAGIVNSLQYQGTWNASTNTPTLATGTGTKGQFYIVSTGGTTTLDGISAWVANDWTVYDGTKWEKVSGNDAAVTSVASRTGAVTLAVADVSGAAPLASPALTGTPTAPTATGGTNTTQVATTAFVLGQGFLSGTVAIAGGGTGQTTRQAAINALTGTQSAKAYLRSDGTNATLATIQAADLPGFDASGYGYPGRMTFLLALGTNLANATNAAGVPFIVPFAGKLVKWKAVASTNPSGGGFSFDLIKNGTTVFSAPQAIAASTTTVQTGSTFAATAIAENDLFTVNISSAGTGVQYVVIEAVFLGANN